MKAYRSYMDRAALSQAAHRRLMAALEGRKRRVMGGLRPAHYSALAAGLLLVCTLGWLAMPRVGGDISPQLSHDAPPGTKDTYGPGETPPIPTAVQQELIPVRFEDGLEAAASIAFPHGWFEEGLTKEQIDHILGRPDTLEAMKWADYDLTGRAVYDGSGAVWRVILDGVSRKEEKNSLSLTLKPGALPEECIVLEGAPSTEINGVPVTGHRGRYGWDSSGAKGENRTVRFMAGDVRVDFKVFHLDGADAEYLATLFANLYAGTRQEIFLDQLAPEEIPEWRSESLDLHEARAQPDLGMYVPQFIFRDFTFESAYWELGQNRNWLSVGWRATDGSYSEARVMIYGNGTYAGSEEPLPRDGLTEEALAQRLTYVDGDSGDSPGYRGRIAVAYDVGETVVEYAFKGLTLEEALNFILGQS